MTRRPPRPKASSPSAEELAEQFIALARVLFRSSPRSQLGPLSAARYEVLHAIFHEGPLPMSQVAARLKVSPRTVTGLVDGLEADGFVERTAHATDRRKTVLALTAGGRDALRAARRVRLADAADRFAVLDPAERRAMRSLLDKLVATVGSPSRT